MMLCFPNVSSASLLYGFAEYLGHWKNLMLLDGLKCTCYVPCKWKGKFLRHSNKEEKKNWKCPEIKHVGVQKLWQRQRQNTEIKITKIIIIIVIIITIYQHLPFLHCVIHENIKIMVTIKLKLCFVYITLNKASDWWKT